jgi:DNA-binding transcriptional ArsR family regulator
MEPQYKWVKSKEANELFEMLKAIAHPSRLAIMYLLSRQKEKRMTVKCIYKELDAAQPVISRHLIILKNTGLLKRINEGSSIFYELCENNKLVKTISDCLAELS